jgi:hypothetical protein
METTAREQIKRYILSGLLRNYGIANKQNFERYLHDEKMEIILTDLVLISTSEMKHRQFVQSDTIKSVGKTALKERWGTLTLNGKKGIHAAPLLNKILFTEFQNGSQNINSALQIKDKIMDSLTELALDQTEDYSSWRYTPPKKEEMEPEYFDTPINTESLRHALADWQYYLNQPDDKSYAESTNAIRKNKLMRNIHISRVLLSSLTDGDINPDTLHPQKVLLQEMNFVDSGRMYLKGLNLQSCPKAVRHAALGKCHLYDMKVGAFAVFGGLANSFDPTKHFHHIQMYIKNKKEVREAVTKFVFMDICPHKDIDDFYGFKHVKNALTAIGFGAKRNAGACWMDANGNWKTTSLLGCFDNDKERLQRFFECPNIKGILQEFIEASNIVLQEYETNPKLSKIFNEKCKSRGQKLGMIYQSIESAILGDFMQLVGRDNILLPAHDGVYLKHKIDYQSVYYKLQIPIIKNKDYIQFEHTWLGQPNEERIYSHNNFIDEEERLAYEAAKQLGLNPLIEQPKERILTTFGYVDASMFNKEIDKMFDID